MNTIKPKLKLQIKIKIYPPPPKKIQKKTTTKKQACLH